jgi:hypothetical protein
LTGVGSPRQTPGRSFARAARQSLGVVAEHGSPDNTTIREDAKRSPRGTRSPRTCTMGNVESFPPIRDRTEMNPPLGPLTYEPPSPSARRHRWARRIALWSSIIVAASLASVWGVPLLEQAKLMYWQHRCMTHVASGTNLLQDWEQFTWLATPPGVVTGQPLFLHEVISPAGHRRLIEIGFTHTAPSAANRGIYFDAWLVEPGGWPLSKPKIRFMTVICPGAKYVNPGPSDTGRTDPADQSHFWMTVGTPATIIDGWLRDDDTIRLEWRPGAKP